MSDTAAPAGPDRGVERVQQILAAGAGEAVPGTGGPDAPGASEGLGAAIEAAAEALWRHAQRGQFDKLAWADIPDHWRPEKFEQAEAAVRAAEPLLRQAVAEDIARRIDERIVDPTQVIADSPHDVSGYNHTVASMAEIAREVGRGE